MRGQPSDPPGGVSTRRYYIPADYFGVTRRWSKKSSRPTAWLYCRFLILTHVVASGVYLARLLRDNPFHVPVADHAEQVHEDDENVMP
jgi:hypothetical protein